jgi:hypothetical protein
MAKNCDQRLSRRTQDSHGQAGASVPEQSCIPPTHFLIANPELEFHVNVIRINELRFPNRKYFTIFHLVLPTVVSKLQATFLIETPRLKYLATTTKQKPNTKSNRDKTRVLCQRFRNGVLESACRRHARIETPNDSLRDPAPLWRSTCVASHATLTLRAPQSNLPASCFVRAPLGEHS